MRKPKCKLCGSEHYSHEDHRWPEETAASGGGAKPARKSVRSDVPGRSDSVELPSAVGKPAANNTAPSFDRNAYQREYMRKWRAKRTAELKRLRAINELSEATK